MVTLLFNFPVLSVLMRYVELHLINLVGKGIQLKIHVLFLSTELVQILFVISKMLQFVLVCFRLLVLELRKYFLMFFILMLGGNS